MALSINIVEGGALVTKRAWMPGKEDKDNVSSSFMKGYALTIQHGQFIYKGERAYTFIAMCLSMTNPICTVSQYFVFITTAVDFDLYSAWF